MLDALANCRQLRAIRRALFSHLPFPVLASDVRDVVYASWVIPVDRVAALVPPSVILMEHEGRTILTVLTYRHNHFGPVRAGPLRRLFPSPQQSNWRLYLAPDGGPATVLFVRNIFDSALYAIGTRLFSDVLPSHWAGTFVHACDEGSVETIIDGDGSSPAFRMTAEVDEGSRTLPDDFTRFFASWQEAVRVICLQDAAVVSVEDAALLALSEISLPIPFDDIQPLKAGHVEATGLLADWGAAGAPFCFRVPAVPFSVLSEWTRPLV